MKDNIIKVFSAMACVFAFGCTEGMDSEPYYRQQILRDTRGMSFPFGCTPMNSRQYYRQQILQDIRGMSFDDKLKYIKQQIAAEKEILKQLPQESYDSLYHQSRLFALDLLFPDVIEMEFRQLTATFRKEIEMKIFWMEYDQKMEYLKQETIGSLKDLQEIRQEKNYDADQERKLMTKVDALQRIISTLIQSEIGKRMNGVDALIVQEVDKIKANGSRLNQEDYFKEIRSLLQKIQDEANDLDIWLKQDIANTQGEIAQPMDENDNQRSYLKIKLNALLDASKFLVRRKSEIQAPVQALEIEVTYKDQINQEIEGMSADQKKARIRQLEEDLNAELTENFKKRKIEGNRIIYAKLNALRNIAQQQNLINNRINSFLPQRFNVKP